MLHILQAHHLVSQQFYCPALTPIGSLATGQMNQLSLSFPIQASPFRAFSRKASGESHFQVPLHKSLLDPNHCAATDVKGFGNLPVGVTGFTLTLIAHQ